MTEFTVKRLSRFPVKGLSAEPLTSVTMSVAEGFPGDRIYGFARHNSGFDPQNPKPIPKDRFVVLLKEAALAGLHTRFDAQSQVLEIRESGKSRKFLMQSGQERSDAALFIHQVLGSADPEPPTFVSSEPHRFTDVSVVSPVMMIAVSVLNIASVKALSQQLNRDVHPARFRANVEIDGLAPFSELEFVGHTLIFGDVRMRILSRTKRCAATEVNPETAERDLRLPYLLNKHLGHTDMGVYAEVTTNGTVFVGQSGRLEI
ncbi:MOSC domain-containing protein [Ruegeria arenilitoris]|uniref:MOSC domain-containing protein n=1 Tax=Ruegeria arenilitoris TaxID=1173585 RepID=UPI00147EB797|nr:MOSC domain-containing protein [Ruegeria arenilitoris]